MKYQVRIDQHTYQVEIDDLNKRPITARVEGETFEIWPEEPLSLPVIARPPAPAPLPSAAPVYRPAGNFAGLTAPIPGTIVSVAVRPGDRVSAGQPLLVLEAMKMKNLIKASRAAQVAAVAVQPGDQVTQGQRLIEFSD